MVTKIMVSIYPLTTLADGTKREEAFPSSVITFEGESWIEALDNAYDWLIVNRSENNVYHVWC